MIYLDNAATTPVAPEVISAMTSVLANNFGNPSSVHSLGRKASQLLRESRATIARILEVAPRELTFTSGASEANNTALIGYALAHQAQGKHIVSTAIEHPSVLNTLDYLQTRYGFEVTFVAPNADGTFSAELIADNLRDDTILVSVMAANNETGQLLPVKEIGALLANHQAAFHVDATQAVGKIPVLPNDIGAAFLSASAHKFHGPKGIGILYHKDSVKFDSLIHGGEQEEKRRAGTENLAAIVGMARALELAHQNMAANYSHIEKLKQELLSNLTEIPDLKFYQNEFALSLPHVVNLGLPAQNHDILLTKLDLAGFAISTGSACTAGTVEPSHVLEAVYGKEAIQLKENIRISFSEQNTLDEVQQFTSTLKNILKK